MKAMILAAGKGERLKPITNVTPKCLVYVNGKTLLERHFNMLVRSGVREVVINLGWLGDKILEFAGDGCKFGLEIHYSNEQDEILETGGGITKALPMLGKEPFWVINGDVFTDFDLPELKLDRDILGHLILVTKPYFKMKGDFDLKLNRVIRCPDPALTFGGIALYHPSIFDGYTVSRFSIVEILYKLIEQKKLTGSIYRGIWEDVGTPDRLKKLNSIS